MCCNQLTNSARFRNRLERGCVGTGHVTLANAHHAGKRGFLMKRISFAIVGAASLALAACGGRDAGDNAAENLEATADNLEEAADNAAGNEAEALENQADALENQADAVDDAADSADANAANVNAM